MFQIYLTTLCLSVKITENLKCSANFHSTHCVFQELASGRTIGNAKEHDGLYMLEEGTNLNKEGLKTSCLQTISIPSDNEVYLLHFRLGLLAFII